MTDFSNSSIRAPNAKKPHIKLVQKWWRVSPLPKPYKASSGALWANAYRYINRLNENLKESSK